MPVEAVETLEEIMNRLLNGCRKEPEAQRSGYINGVLDMYNEAKKAYNKNKEADVTP